MLLSFVRLPHPAACSAAVEFDVRGRRREKEGEGESKDGGEKKRRPHISLRFSSSREN